MNKSIILIAILAASVSCQQRTVKGCYHWNNNTNTCGACHRRQVTSNGCGPLLPPSDTCLIHAEQAGQKTNCELCKLGYGYNLGNSGPACLPLNIRDCAIGGVDSSGQANCIVCARGLFPQQEVKATDFCAPQTPLLPNCSWVEKLIGTPATCNLCNVGYVRKGPGCIPETAATVGCLTLNKAGTACYTCDAAAGYSMQKNGKCKFVSQ